MPVSEFSYHVISGNVGCDFIIISFRLISYFVRYNSMWRFTFIVRDVLGCSLLCEVAEFVNFNLGYESYTPCVLNSGSFCFYLLVLPLCVVTAT